MVFKPLSTDFKDEILSEVNTQRKYKQTVNEDGTVSLQDMTAYEQEGSTYSAKDINEERKAINDIYANKVVSLEEASLVTEPGFFCDALVINETNKNLTDKLDKDYTLANGVWYANGTVIPLKDSYLNYRDIIIRTGWNNQNGGIRDHRLSIQKNATTIEEIVPIYQATKYIGVLVVEFNPNTPNQIKIVQSTGMTSASAANGIRYVMGRTKLS